MTFVYKSPSRVRTYEVDANNHLSLPFLVGYMQEAAAHHAHELGASMDKLREQGVAWALSRMRLEIMDYPSVGEEVEIHTWPSGWEKFFFYRDYRLFRKNGELLAQATSTWLMFDIETRRLASRPELATNIRPPEGVDHLDKATAKIRFPEDDHHSHTFKANWFDLDVNHHVNNLRYFQWAMEFLPHSHIKKKSLTEIELIFKNEALLGDRLIADSHFGDEDNCIHRLKNSEGKELILGVTKWK